MIEIVETKYGPFIGEVKRKWFSIKISKPYYIHPGEDEISISAVGNNLVDINEISLKIPKKDIMFISTPKEKILDLYIKGLEEDTKPQ